MKIVLQRVKSANVKVNENVVGSIENGYVIFLGVAKGDNEKIAEKLVDKISRLRIFCDENGKTNLSSSDVNGQLLVVSQFTLLADLSSNRPSFSYGADAATAKRVYEHFVAFAKDKFSRVQTGMFGEDMQVTVINDGPFTLVLEEKASM